MGLYLYVLYIHILEIRPAGGGEGDVILGKKRKSEGIKCKKKEERANIQEKWKAKG
jgi:hypothetical protein